MAHTKKPSDGKKLSLDPLTFDEALAGLLATEPPAKPAKAVRASKNPPKPAKRSKTTTRRKRTPTKPS